MQATALAHALRSLRRAPVYATTVILTLALGLASVGAMLAVVHGVLLAPLPYGEPERLVDVHLDLAQGGRVGLSPALQATYRRHSTQLEDIALYRSGSANVWTPQGVSDAESLAAAWISASTMRLLHTVPLLGRTFSEDEARRGGPDAVILSEWEWRERFGASPDAIGTTLVVNDVPREIVGVMPAQFAFPGAGTRLWLPAKSSDSRSAGDFFYAGVARLASGATVASARRELVALLPRLAEDYPRLQSGGSTAAWLEDAQPATRVRPLIDAITGRIAPTLLMLAGVAGLVLLVAWANVANLVLIRAETRRREEAVRLALGASPLRASAPALIESAVLGAIAAALAVLASLGALAALRAWGPADLPRLGDAGLGPGIAGVIVLLALLGTVGGTVLLARLQGRGRVLRGLREAARGVTAGRARQRLRVTVTVLQIAAALVVLAASALLLRTAQRLHDVHPGFDADQVSTFRILLPFARYGDAARVAFHAELTERAAQLASVSGAGLTAHLPLGSGTSPEQPFRIEGEGGTRSLPVTVVGGGYFGAMRIPVLAGRDFRALGSQRAGEIIINQRAALALFGDPRGIESLGRTLHLDPGGPTYTIVGVVGDVRYEDLALAPTARVYRPQVVAAAPATQPGPLPAMVLVVRSQAPPDALLAAIRGIVRDLDPNVPVFDVSRMADVVRHSTARLTLVLWATTAAAAVTLVLGMIGLYGVMAYLVTLRTREFGLRIALGADPARIARWIVARGLALTAIGVTGGALVFVVAAIHLRAAIPAVAVWDPLPLAGAIGLLAATAALACWIPARRAAAVDPVQSLRSE